jgi:hypothetical protein
VFSGPEDGAQRIFPDRRRGEEIVAGKGDSRLREFTENFGSAQHPRALFCLNTIMRTMRESWTDERLDDGFDRVTADIAMLRGEVGSLRREMHDQIGGLRLEMHDQIGDLREDFAALQRTLLQVGGGVIVALLGIIVTQL